MSIETMADISKVKKGDMIVLRDYHSLANTGGEYTGQISDVNRWENDALSYNGFEISVDDDTTLMLLVRQIGEEADVRLYRLWDSKVASEFDGVALFSFKDEEEDEEIDEDDDEIEDDDEEDEEEDDADDAEVNLVDFAITHEGEEDDGALVYEVKSPYPFWDMKKQDGTTVAVCEYLAVDEEIDDVYWAKHSFVEWYSFVGTNGEDGLLSLWFGWDIGDSDFDFIKG